MRSFEMLSPKPSAQLVSLMLADGRLPAGGYTQSGGLEPAVGAGLVGIGGQADVPGYLSSRLQTIVPVEAGTAVAARHVVLTGLNPLAVEEHWAARTPSQFLRSAARRQGRGYLRLAERVWPQVLDHLPRDAEIARAVVIGTIGAVTGIDARGIARLVAYDDVQTVTAASTKLLPIDPLTAAGWLNAVHDEIEQLSAQLAVITKAQDIPALGAPLIDHLSDIHAHEKMRLFHA